MDKTSGLLSGASNGGQYRLTGEEANVVTQRDGHNGWVALQLACRSGTFAFGAMSRLLTGLRNSPEGSPRLKGIGIDTVIQYLLMGEISEGHHH